MVTSFSLIKIEDVDIVFPEMQTDTTRRLEGLRLILQVPTLRGPAKGEFLPVNGKMKFEHTDDISSGAGKTVNGRIVPKAAW
jgi:hypothetical protein